MSEFEKWVAVISPWDKLSAVVKKNFRVESLPEEKKVMVWRDDLQSEQALAEELKQLGVGAAELRKKKVTARWQDLR
jgi:hypothetical protein